MLLSLSQDSLIFYRVFMWIKVMPLYKDFVVVEIFIFLTIIFFTNLNVRVK